MTKSTITRERIQRIIRAINSEAYDEEEIREWLSSDEIMELSRMALAAMDGEPEYLPLDYLQGHKDGLEWASQLAKANHPETGDWLYDDPIELAKAIRKGPDMPPVRPTPVVSAELLHTAASAIEDLLTTKDRTGACVWFDLPFRLRSAANAQPAPVVPVCTCPSGDGSLRWPCPVHPGNSPVVPDGIERVASMAEYLGNFAAAAIIRQLAANQPQDAQQNIPEIIPDCWCRTCRPVVLNDMRFVVCPDCGNKRCPRANDHRNACTGSNEPGQEGSAYPDTPREVK